MTILQVMALGIMSAVLAVSLKDYYPGIAMGISVAASITIFLTVLPMMESALRLFQNLAAQLDSNVQHVSVVLRILGIAYAAEIGSQVCADADENAIAANIEMAGKVLIVAVAAPILLDVIHMIVGILP